jgi:hypothetical protein
MINVYDQGSIPIICKISHYVGNAVGYVAFLIVC